MNDTYQFHHNSINTLTNLSIMKVSCAISYSAIIWGLVLIWTVYVTWTHYEWRVLVLAGLIASYSYWGGKSKKDEDEEEEKKNVEHGWKMIKWGKNMDLVSSFVQKEQKVKNEEVVDIASQKTDGDDDDDEKKETQAQSSRTTRHSLVVCRLKKTDFSKVGEMTNLLLKGLRPEDSVLICINSPGGLPHKFGLVATHLRRLVDHGHKVIVSVDEVAASGGYMVACVASKIIASPWAYLGSVGVIANTLNFSDLLKRVGVQAIKVTSGQLKCPIDETSPITPENLQYHKEKVEEMGVLFRRMVTRYRPQVNKEKMATADIWTGEQACEIGLVDELKTSEEFILDMSATHDVFVLERFRKSKDTMTFTKMFRDLFKMGITHALKETF